MLIVYLLAIAGAALNAVSIALQRIAAGQSAHKGLFKRRFIWAMTKHPLFLWGMLLQIMASLLQVLALSKGPLVIVQPLMTLDMVFLFLIIHFRFVKFDQRVSAKDWIYALAVIIGLSSLFLIARPVSGNKAYHLVPWLIVLASVGAVMATSFWYAQKPMAPKTRAALVALAAACSYALNDALAKLNLNFLKAHSWTHLLSTWPIYALLVCSLLSIYLMENVYGAGPLKASQPVNEVVEPTLTVIIGIVIFGDAISHSALSIGGELLSLAVLLWGMIRLASAKEMTTAKSLQPLPAAVE